ncbi:ComEC/Rec2 family competence protein [Polaribacter sp.]|uniref:ComEC/Rec2 family competence protein n=1 Tax=Polaribacter sp. TaxID=1920175 RepID=UPI003EF29FC4
MEFYVPFWPFSFFTTGVIFLPLAMFFLVLKNRIVLTLYSWLFFFFVGVAVVFLGDTKNYDNYYQHYIKDNSTAIFRVKKVLKPNNYYAKYQVEVIQVNSVKTVGNILLNIQKDSIANMLAVDDVITLKPNFKELTSPLNPHQFNYKSYLAKQGVYQQVFLKENEFLQLHKQGFSLVGWSAKSRNTIQKSLQKHHFKENELAVMYALLLGQRQDISKELITDYQRAGAIHILAVSGLHVGVFLLILNFLFKPLERVKYGIIFKTSIIIILLWMFAFIAGLSASVVRAVTMFTFVAFGLALKRKKVIEFSLISSMLFLLMVKPMFLFDVGFQLSYLAVFSIVWLQPKLQEIWKPKNKVFLFFWQIFTVSIAAQLGVLPLSIFYFQQFPGLFMLSNFVIIPCLMYILIGGNIVIVLSLCAMLPAFFVTIYGTVISWMNGFVHWISNQEEFLFKEISMSFLSMMFWYVLIVFGFRFFIHKTAKRLLFLLCAVLIIQSTYLLEYINKKDKKELLLFHKNKQSIIGKRIGDTLFLQHQLDTVNYKDDYSLKSYRIAEGVSNIHETSFHNFLKFSNKNILFVDSLGVYNLRNIEAPIVVLQYSPKINLSRLIKKIKPSQIIADGSNYKSFVLKWKLTCSKENIPFYDTREKGAFVLKD